MFCARSILNLKSASLHQSSASSLLIDLTIRISFCNTTWKCSNVEKKNKQTNKKQGPMILIPLEPQISPLTTWFSIFLTALKAMKRSLTISAWDGTSGTSTEYKHALIPFLTRNTLSQNPCKAVKDQQWIKGNKPKKKNI